MKHNSDDEVKIIKKHLIEDINRIMEGNELPENYL